MPSATGAAPAKTPSFTPRVAAALSPMPGVATPASAATTPGLFGSHLQAPSASAPGSSAASPRPMSSSSANVAGGTQASSQAISVQATSIPSVALNAVAASAAAAKVAGPAASSNSTTSAAAAERLQDPTLFPTLLPKMEVLLELLAEAGHKTAALWEASSDGAPISVPVVGAPMAAPSTGGGLALGSSADDELAYSLVSHLEASGERANRKPTPLNEAIVKASQQLASTYNATRAAIRALGEGADMPLVEIRELEGTLVRYENRLKALGGATQEGSGGDSVMT